MKKKILLILVCLLVFALGSACGKSDISNGNKGDAGYGEIVDAGGTEGKQFDFLSFEEDTLDVIVGDETALKLGYASSTNASPSFKSSDTDVVSVDGDGIISALKAGSAMITAGLGSLTDTVVVTVGYGSYLPVGKFSNEFPQTGDLQISTADFIDFSSAVYFNSKRFDDAQVSYECTGNGSMNGDIFTPTAAGEATVKINVVWRGFDIYLSRNEFTVKIVHDVQLYINDNDSCSLELYTAESLTTDVGTETFVHTLPFVIRGKVDGQVLAKDKINGELTEGKDVVRIENDVIKGIKQGRATYTLTYNDGENEYKKSIPIEVKVSSADYNTVPIRFSALDGKLENISWEKIFGDDKIVEAAIGKTSLTVEGKGVTGLKVKATDKRNTQTLTVRTDKVGYNFQIVPYTMIIKTPQDFDVFTIEEAVVANGKVESATCFDGYYILGNDVTWDSTTHNVDKNAALGTVEMQKSHEHANVGLTGVFDGDGHTITGMKVTSGGLLGFVSGGTVKNVGFLNVLLEGENTGANKAFGQSKSTLAFSLKNAKVENVYIQADNVSPLVANKTGNRSLVTNVIVGTTVIKDSVFRLDETETINGRKAYNGNYAYGALCGVDYRSYNKSWSSHNNNWDGAKTYDRSDWRNVYVISATDICAEQNWDAATPTVYELLRYDETTSTYVKLDAVKRYDNEEAFKAAKNDYSGFDTKYWTINTETNSITWKTASI